VENLLTPIGYLTGNLFIVTINVIDRDGCIVDRNDMVLTESNAIIESNIRRVEENPAPQTSEHGQFKDYQNAGQRSDVPLSPGAVAVIKNAVTTKQYWSDAYQTLTIRTPSGPIIAISREIQANVDVNSRIVGPRFGLIPICNGVLRP
jgi:hypothetical protein